VLTRVLLSITVVTGAWFSASESSQTLMSVDPLVVDGETGANNDGFDTLWLNAAQQGQPPGTTGSAAATSGTDPSGPKDPMAGVGQLQDVNWCGWTDVPTQPPVRDPAWEGNDPSAGSVRWKSCSILLPGTPGAPGNLEGRPVITQFFPNAVAAAPPPPNPAVLAREAIGQLKVPPPAIGAGPARDKLAVNLWTWLWIDNPGPLSATVTAGTVSVTATAILSTVTWSLGEPTTTGDTYSPGPTATLTCQGTGTSPPVGYDWRAQPPCGHMFHWRSLKERTGGTGKWPIAATSNWNVTWASNTGVTGATTLNATGNDQFDVEEYRIVLVQQPGG
jgi:hypothetical protein